MKIPLKTRIHRLRTKVKDLQAVRTPIKRDIEAGRVHVRMVNIYLDAADKALSQGDDEGAGHYVMEALEAWGMALEIQMPDINRARLTKLPEAGGRPSQAALDVRLYLVAEEHTGTKVARCRAAITEDETLRTAFNMLTDDALRKAWGRGERELKQE